MNTKSLRFLPHMTLQAAARIAGQHGMELHVRWDGKQPIVEAYRPIKDDELPEFLRKQAS